MSARLNVLVCAPIMGRDLGPIRHIDVSLDVVDGNDVFIAYTDARRRNDAAVLESTTRELRALLARADVVCMMYPMVEDVVAYAPRLRWLHHTQAGVSNLWASDVWGASGVTITSGRGHVRPTAIAEYCVAGILLFARAIHEAYVDKRGQRLDRDHYDPIRAAGAVVGIVGLGGIGQEVARLARALGMRVIATRRSAQSRACDVDGVDVLLPPAGLAELAAESDFIVVSTALTRETQGLLTPEFFAATEKRPVLINISRGEVIDEAAMLAALDRGILRGAVLDVYAGELERRPPRAELLSHRNVVLTPHISGQGDLEDQAFMRLFCENLRRYVAGEPLLNVVDRTRGY